MWKWLKNIFRKKSTVIDANIHLGIYSVSIAPSGKLIAESDIALMNITGVYEMNISTKEHYNLPSDKIVLDVLGKDKIYKY